MTNHTVCQQSIRSRYEEKHPKRCEADSLHPQESKLNLLLLLLMLMLSVLFCLSPTGPDRH